MYNVACKKCPAAQQIETTKRKVAVRTLIHAGWTQTSTGWECYDCLVERKRKNDAREGNGKADRESAGQEVAV